MYFRENSAYNRKQVERFTPCGTITTAHRFGFPHKSLPQKLCGFAFDIYAFPIYSAIDSPPFFKISKAQ